MVFGGKPGKGAVAIEDEKEKAENIINFFADEFDGSYEKSITLYNKLCENGNAVSYTHLDVYKRQT